MRRKRERTSISNAQYLFPTGLINIGGRHADDVTGEARGCVVSVSPSARQQGKRLVSLEIPCCTEFSSEENIWKGQRVLLKIY